ncbi:MAG TPA: C2H2-type zinc finger protein [Candidatus Nitrosotalea sp.]|nr:C2H2-type zinc finger protein [Candidatus Nitrosotalea sp.]
MADAEKKCNICGKAFENSSKLNQHMSESHKSTKIPKTVSKSSRNKATAIAAVIAVIIVAAVYLSENQQPPATVIQGVRCDPTEAIDFHIHAHLDVIVDGKPVTVPAGIGIKPNECLYWIHTHDTSGIIHIEAPKETAFTLGQFIQVWDNTGISPKFEEMINGDKNYKIFVNGFEYKDGFDKIPLTAHDEIVVVSGDVPPTLPKSFEFNGQ